MKELTAEDHEDMDLNGAWKIAYEYSSFLTLRHPLFKHLKSTDYHENNLPYDKYSIKYALVKILVEENCLHKNFNIKTHNITSETIRRSLGHLILSLSNYFPNEEQYRIFVENVESKLEYLPLDNPEDETGSIDYFDWDAKHAGNILTWYVSTKHNS